MRFWPWTLSRLLLLVLVLGGAGCVFSPGLASPTTTPGIASPSPEASPVEAGPPALSVTDALGRNLTFHEPPQRVVVAGKASLLLAEAVYAFPQARQKVVALTRGKQGLDFLALVDPQVTEKAVLAPDIGPEAIAARQPDVVLMRDFLAAKLGKAVEALGIPVFYMRLETPEDYANELRQLGALLGEPDRGAALAAYYTDKVRQVQERLDALSPEQRPTTLMLRHNLKGGESAYFVPPAAWIQTEMVRLGGGDPIWAAETTGSSWNVVSAEQIASWNPEVILVIDYFASPEEAAQNLTQADWAASLRAVQAQRVFPFPKDFLSWDQPDPRWALGLLWTAHTLHPERTASWDLRAEVALFYRTFYGLDEAGMAPVWERLDANGGLK